MKESQVLKQVDGSDPNGNYYKYISIHQEHI